MASLYMITARCKDELFDRLEAFSQVRNIDRTSAMKLALHYYFNLHHVRVPKRPRRRKDGGDGKQAD